MRGNKKGEPNNHPALQPGDNFPTVAAERGSIKQNVVVILS